MSGANLDNVKVKIDCQGYKILFLALKSSINEIVASTSQLQSILHFLAIVNLNHA